MRCITVLLMHLGGLTRSWFTWVVVVPQGEDSIQFALHVQVQDHFGCPGFVLGLVSSMCVRSIVPDRSEASVTFHCPRRQEDGEKCDPHRKAVLLTIVRLSSHAFDHALQERMWPWAGDRMCSRAGGALNYHHPVRSLVLLLHVLAIHHFLHLRNSSRHPSSSSLIAYCSKVEVWNECLRRNP